MNKKSVPEICVEEIMKQVRAEVKTISPFAAADGPCFEQHGSFPTGDSMPAFLDLKSFSDSEDFTVKKEGYVINDFLKYSDSKFVENAYIAILGRRADRNGHKFYLDALRHGKMNKTEILGRLRYSPEGKAKGIKIQGLFFRCIVQASYKIPFFGYALRWVTAIIQAPTIINNYQEFDGYVRNHFLHVEDHWEQLRDKLQAKINELIAGQSSLTEMLTTKAEKSELESQIGTLEQLREEKVDRNDLDLLASKTSVQDLAEELSVLTGDLETLKSNLSHLDLIVSLKADQQIIAATQESIKEIQRQTRDHKLNITDQQRRVALLLEEVRKRLPDHLGHEQMSTIVTEQEHLLDAFYVSFEDQFRGTREDIKKRQEIYLHYISEIGAGTDDAPVLDVGCGRGEWLELLKESGHTGIGVDHNRVMVQQCLETDLKVVEADLIEFLREQKANSFGAVTGYHIIEHLPLKTFICLLDESLRVLQPGGMIIFETPNPENLFVGASQFFIDPTHRNPLYPSSVKYIAEQRGFIKTEVLRLHKIKEPTYTNQEYVDEIISKANLEQDYSLIGYKA